MKLSATEQLDAYLKNVESFRLHPSEIASLLQSLSDDKFQVYITKLPKELIGDIALELPDRYFGNVIENLSVKELAEAVTELESDDQTDFMQELEESDEAVAKEVFEALPHDDQADITQLKTYDDDDAGAYMQTEVFTARLNEKVQDVVNRFARLRKAEEIENVHNLFITDNSGVLRYVIALDDLLIFDFSQSFDVCIADEEHKYNPIVALDSSNISEAVRTIEEFNLNALAIVSSDGKLLGRITGDDVYDIIQELSTEQMYRMAGVDDDAEEDELILSAGKKRAFWLSINLVTAIIASLVIGMFEETLQSLVALAILMPIVASMGGNAGTQSLTVVVRQLALGDITKNDAIRTIKKEVFIALGNGFVFALVMGLISYLWFNIPLLGVVIGLSMLINLFSAGFFGAAIPLVLKRMNIDPAIGSTVILTTVTDVVGFLSFLGLATVILF
jgi:magnesium transporter